MDEKNLTSSQDQIGFKKTSSGKREFSLTINKSIYDSEVKTIKRQHVLQSPAIVITCPADTLPATAFCSRCNGGPVCCYDQSSDEETTSSSSRSSCISKVSSHKSHSQLVCCDCGTSISNSSAYSTCSSDEEGSFYVSSNSNLKRFTSVGDLSRDFKTYQENQENEYFSSSSSTASSDDEEVICVEIDEKLKEVVDEHLSSRKNSSASSIDSLDDSDDSSSKESEILQRFLEQVEQHPQEEDLDVILEIVGEEDDEPCTRSLLNIRECSEKFKEIYAKKLKQIYHNKNRDSRMKRYDELKKQVSGKTSVQSLKYSDDHYENSHSDTSSCSEAFEDSLEVSSTTSSSESEAKSEKTIIDKLPEIRKFHPNCLDPKMSTENLTYLRATSLINEIESCFMETALLVEKSIGSNNPSPFILKKDWKEQCNNWKGKLHADNGCASDAFEENENKNQLDANDSNEFSSYQREKFNLHKNSRVLNEFQRIFEKKTNQTSGETNAEVSHEQTTLDFEEEFLNPSENAMDHSIETQSSSIFSTKEASSFNSSQNESSSISRTLEESIDMFDKILADRNKETVDSSTTFRSSYLVLNSDREFQKQLQSEAKQNKFKSTNDLSIDEWLDSFDKYALNSSNSSIEPKNKQSMKYCNADNNYFKSRNMQSLDYDSQIRVEERDTLTLPRKSRKKQNTYSSTYLKFDSIEMPTPYKYHFDTLGQLETNDKEMQSKDYDEKLLMRVQDQVKSFLKDPVNSKSETAFVDSLDSTSKISSHINESENSNGFSKWKSEPDFGRFSYPFFGLQSSFREEYYEKDYTTTSITTTVYNKSSEPNVEPMVDNEINKSPKENFSLSVNNDETIEILSQQPLFAQIDELLKGLEESRVDSITSDTDEGVVSDQSDLSDQAASTDMLDVNSDHDKQLENDIKKIITGINCISEKHLGETIERELDSLLESQEVAKKLENCHKTEMSTQSNYETQSNDTILWSNVKKLDEYILKLDDEIANIDSGKDPLSEISRISQELKNIDHKHFDSSLPLLNLQKTLLSERKIVGSGGNRRLSRKEHHEFQSNIWQTNQNTSKLVEGEKHQRSLSCSPYFLSSECKFPSTQDIDFEKAVQSCNLKTRSESAERRNSFILRTLHDNLRYYVITLAMLEKMLKGDQLTEDDCGYEEDTLLPLQQAAISDLNNLHQTSPFDSGQKAFLLGLQRQHQLQVKD